MSRAGLRDVVGLVHHHETDASRRGEPLRVVVKELRCGQHDVDEPVAEAFEDLGPLSLRRLTGERPHDDAHLGERLVEVERLVRDQRAQRIDEHARGAVAQRLPSGVQVEDQRLASRPSPSR